MSRLFKTLQLSFVVYRSADLVQTKLDKLLESIDPVQTVDEVSARVDEAINSFNVGPGVIRQWEEFQLISAKFFCHIENIVLRIHPPRSLYPDFDWGRCYRLLINEYGTSGEKAAFEMVRTGAEGGLYAVLKSIAKQMINQYAGNEISGRISCYLENLTVDQHIAASQEYLLKYGHLLPSELTEGSAARIHVNFIKVLEEHPNLIKRMRNIR
jgi:hypothetical protein